VDAEFTTIGHSQKTQIDDRGISAYYIRVLVYAFSDDIEDPIPRDELVKEARR
jgi:hypothetical protein